MATRTPVKTQTPAPAATPAPEATLHDLIEQKRALDAQIKAARDAQPKLSKLEKVALWQTENPSKWLPLHLSNRVKARVKAGQPRAEAIDAVLGQFRAILEAETPTND